MRIGFHEAPETDSQQGQKAASFLTQPLEMFLLFYCSLLICAFHILSPTLVCPPHEAAPGESLAGAVMCFHRLRSPGNYRLAGNHWNNFTATSCRDLIQAIVQKLGAGISPCIMHALIFLLARRPSDGADEIFHQQMKISAEA